MDRELERLTLPKSISVKLDEMLVSLVLSGSIKLFASINDCLILADDRRLNYENYYSNILIYNKFNP